VSDACGRALRMSERTFVSRRNLTGQRGGPDPSSGEGGSSPGLASHEGRP
jgi:hypothetical protein